MVSHQITLRAWSANADLPPIQINQGDILSRTVFITLVSGGQAVDLTSSTARVHFSKPDGTVVYLTASIVNAAAGIISVTLDSQCTAAPGLVKSIVQVTGPNGENLFFVGLNFQVAVVNIEDSIVSSNEFTALTDALATVQDIDNKADKTTTDNLQNQIDAHTSRTDNPHSVTAAQVGAIPASQKGAAGGVASLGADGLVEQNPASLGQANGAALQLPSSTVQLLNGVTVAYGTPPRFAGCGKVGIFVAVVDFPADFTISKTFALLPFTCNRIEGSLMSETGSTRFLSLYSDRKSLKVEGSISGVAGIICHVYALLELI